MAKLYRENIKEKTCIGALPLFTYYCSILILYSIYTAIYYDLHYVDARFDKYVLSSGHHTFELSLLIT